MVQDTIGGKPVEEVLLRERVGSICHLQPAIVLRGTSMAETLESLRGGSGGCVVVVALEGTRRKPVGIFTERDYLDKLAGLEPGAWEEAQLAPVERFMTASPMTIAESESLQTAIQLMTQGGYRHLPLVDRSGSLVGVLSARDLIRRLAEFFPVEVMNLPPRLHQDERIRSREGG